MQQLYRLHFDQCEHIPQELKDKVQVLKHVIDEYDKDWELVEIGAPNDENIPLMFRKKTE